jgi:hypothetical protein
LHLLGFPVGQHTHHGRLRADVTKFFAHCPDGDLGAGGAEGVRGGIDLFLRYRGRSQGKAAT